MEKINVEETLNKMSLKEKVLFLCGSSPMFNHGVDRLNIPALAMNDGPNGLRRNQDEGDSLGGIANTKKSTVFPCAALLASTWNVEIVNKVGDAIGKECEFYKTNMLLGPATNIKRNPLCGRNFEYYSEDPFLSGNIASSFVNGVESHNVSCCVKHFACNNSEKFRFIGDVKIDERALREIYLKPYEIILKNTNVGSFMTAYNQVNDEYCSQNPYLLKKFLREDNGFEGVVVTDWGAVVDRVKSLENSMDVEMPGEIEHNMVYVYDSVKNGKLDEKYLNESCSRLLNLYNKTVFAPHNDYTEEIFKENYEVALKAALEGMVLLKNDGALPLKKEKRILVVGDAFNSIRYQGSGSSLLDPYYFKNIKDVFNEKRVNYSFLKAYDETDEESEADFEIFKKELAKNHNYDAFLMFGGQNDFVESEGFDRDTIKLPIVQLKVVEELAKYNIPIIFVLAGGSVVELPFKDKVNAILDAFLGGEAVSEALYKILFGEVSPSGKLTETFVESYDDVPFGSEFSTRVNAYYKESLFVGYRYYEKAKVKVAFPFGHGLTYTHFDYSSLTTKVNEKTIDLSFTLTNSGNYDAKEISEVYVSKKDSVLTRPIKELKGFRKTFLKKGESKTINLSINIDDLKVYDIKNSKWILEEGEYEILIGKSSSDIVLSSSISLKGEKIENSELLQEIFNKYQDIKKISDEEYARLFNLKYIPEPIYKKPYGLETPFYAYTSFMGKIFRFSTISVGKAMYKKAKKIKDPILRARKMKAGYFVMRLMPVNSIRSLSFSSSGSLPFNIASGLLEMFNGHYLKGIKKMMKKEKIHE